jgi:hypothetical protein
MAREKNVAAAACLSRLDDALAGHAGAYVAPMPLMMLAACVFTIGLRRFAARFTLLRYDWHPSLFVFAVYMIVLSSIVR